MLFITIFPTTSYTHGSDRKVRGWFPGCPCRSRLRQGQVGAGSDGHPGGLQRQDGAGDRHQEGQEREAPDGPQRSPHPCGSQRPPSPGQPGAGIQGRQGLQPARLAGVLLPLQRGRGEDRRPTGRGRQVHRRTDGRDQRVHRPASWRSGGTQERTPQDPPEQPEGRQVGRPG